FRLRVRSETYLSRWNRSKPRRKIPSPRVILLPGLARPVVPSAKRLRRDASSRATDSDRALADMSSVQFLDGIRERHLFRDLDIREAGRNASDEVSNHAYFFHCNSSRLDPIGQFGITAVVGNIHEEECAHVEPPER